MGKIVSKYIVKKTMALLALGPWAKQQQILKLVYVGALAM
jgi:hypothetical protein